MAHRDDLGILWQALPKERGAPIFQPRPLPPCAWKAPTELPSLRGLKRISFDIETYDPDLIELGPGTRRGAYVVGLALGTEDGRRWYFPVRHQGGGNMDEAQVKRWAHEELNQYDGEIVGAHLLYDLEHMAMPEWNVTFPRVRGFHDVLLAEPLIDEWRPNGYSLDAVGGYHFGEEGHKRHETLFAAAINMGGWRTERQVKSNLWRLPAAYVGEYGEGDADLPLRILERQLPLIEKEELGAVYDVERGLLPLLLAMRLRGVPVNVARAEEVHERVLKERDKWLSEVKRLAGPQAELMAPASFAKALQDRGLQIPVTAKTKQPSVTKAWLKQYEGKDALVDAIQAGRRVDKIISTYTGNVLRYNIGGRIFAEFPQLKGENGGTIARFSSSKPNLQNQPARDEELGPLTRSIFEPESGEVWERQDACLTGDTEIITIDGIKPIRDLVLNPVPVLSAYGAERLAFNKVTRAQCMGVRPVYEITLQNGSTVRCTEEHEWIDRWGKVIETRNLRERRENGSSRQRFAGECLAHVHTQNSKYQTWCIKSLHNYVTAHILIAEYEYGPCPDGYEVDHKDGDASNWARGNLQYLPISVNRGHAASRWWNKATQEERDARTKALVEGQKVNRRSYEGENNPNYGKKRPGVGGRPKNGSFAPCLICGKDVYSKPSNPKEFCSIACYTASGRSSQRKREKASRFAAKVQPIINSIEGGPTDIVEELNRRGVPTPSGRGKWWPTTVTAVMQNTPHNHRVVSVRYAGMEPVYALTVEDAHTYVLANGLVSGNSQIEFRILVHMAASAKDRTGRPLPGAEEARAAYATDPTTDFHALTATMIGVDPTDKIARKRVKSTNFGAVYMGGEETLARTIGCSLEEARAFLKTYHSKLPFVRQIGLIAMDTAKSRGYVRTLLGRRQRFTMWEPRGHINKGGGKQERKEHMMLYDEAVSTYGENGIQRAFCHAGLNRVLQGSAADILKKGMQDAWRAGVCDVLGAPLVTVHDELGWSVPPGDKHAEEAAAEARRSMENAIPLCLPLMVDYDQGPNWGACK